MGSQASQASGTRKTQTSTTSNTTLNQGSVTVEIRGQRMSIRSDKDHAFVESLANYVDEKVASLQSAAPTAPFDKLLMLASMTVTEELFETQKQLKELQRHTREKASTLFELLEECENL